MAGFVLPRRAMINRKILLGLAPMAVVLMIAGCATDTSAPTDGEEGPTAEETAAGDAWSGGDGSEHDGDHDDGIQTLASDPEDSAPWLDQGAASDVEGAADEAEQLTPEDIAETTACRRATGYRRGKAFAICVVTVDGKLVEVNTARAYLRMKRAARNKGVSLWINSGFRTMAQQRYLYNCYRTKRCNGGNLAAPPGYSNHQSGHALDLNTSARGVYSFLSRYGRSYGFRRTVPSERWHWEH
jgi:hypothetical protein